MEKEEKVLTREVVLELGLDKLEVITSDMLDGYTSIGHNAFLGFLSIRSITIPNSVTSIGYYAFLGCNSLRSITIPNSVTSIGDCAFVGCASLPVEDNLRYADTYLVEVVDKSLSTYTIKDGTNWIGTYAFYDCFSLTSITIPNSVTSIGCWAFAYCKSLTYINIPNSITSIGDCAFDNCTSLPVEDNLRYADTYLVEVVDKSLSTYTIKDGTKWIGYSVFYNCSSLTSITIPNSVTSIETSAFYGCSSITSITIPNSVTKIERHTFDKCNKLKSIIIGDKTYEQQTIVNDKCKAYKVFHADMTCFNGYLYREGKTYEIDGEPELCKQGFHACLRLTDVFNYYFGEIGKDIVVHEVELEGVSEKTTTYYSKDSKVVAKKITIGKRIL